MAAMSAPVAKADWVRVGDPKPYIDSGDFAEYGERAFPWRLYRPKDNPYPLLLISIHAAAEPALAGIILSVSFKPNKGEWWEDHHPHAAVPLALFGDLFEMLREAETKLQNLHACA